MAGPSVLRLITIGAVPASGTFDGILRDEVLPLALTLAGVVDAQIARRFGPADVDERVIATFWESGEAMDAAIVSRAVEHLEHDLTGRTEVLPLAISLRFQRPDVPARILRIFRGQIRPGELDLYVEDARRGATADGASGHGPLAFFLSSLPPSHFLSLSLWGDWSEIERSTGGDGRRPIATHHAERILSGQASHYEILRGAEPGSPARARDSGGTR